MQTVESAYVFSPSSILLVFKKKKQQNNKKPYVTLLETFPLEIMLASSNGLNKRLIGDNFNGNHTINR